MKEVNPPLNRSLSMFRIALLLTLICWQSAGRVSAQHFKNLSAAETGIQFENTFNSPDSFDIAGFLYLWNGGGVAIGDVNNDGLQDIFFTGNTVGNRLYLNKGDLKFEDVTERFGLPLSDNAWNTGVTMADVNGDGFLDIHVSRSQLAFRKGHNLLYINEQGRAFHERSVEIGLNIEDNCTQASFFDADNDGDLDMYLLTYPEEGAQYSVYKSTYTRGNDRLYYNENGKFMERPEAASRLKHNGFGLGVITADMDQNGEVDIYVANDLMSIDRYYTRSNGVFTESLEKNFGHVSFNSMGADAADINNDGWLDIITTDMFPEDADRRHLQSFLSSDLQAIIERGGLFKQYVRNMVQVNVAGQGFRESGEHYGVGATDWSWGPLVFDANNDGMQDLVITNSLKKDFMNMDFSKFLLDTMTRYDKPNQKNRVYKSIVDNLPEFRLQNKFFIQYDGVFIDKSDALNMSKKVNSTGAAIGDLDNDGDQDLVLNNLDTAGFIVQNMLMESGTTNQFIRLKLLGADANTQALNAKITVYSGSQKRLFETLNARGFQSCSEHIVHIGYTAAMHPDSIVIRWVNGATATLTDVKINDLTIVKQPTSSTTKGARQPESAFFSSVRDAISPSIIHQENLQNDFKADPILHRQLSTTGPGIAIGDVNSDGIMDFYQCAPKGSKGIMYWGDNAGHYAPAPLQPWEEEPGFEESAALLIDVDNDSDLDLIIAGSGYEQNGSTPWFWDRLFLNNGKGFFSKSEGLPKLAQSKSCMAAADMDADGDMDLFIGGRYANDGYPTPANSYLLINNGKGIFADATHQLAPSLTEIGLVTSAIWSDHDNDGDPDLLVVGEWMAPTLLENRNGQLHKVSLMFSDTAMTGWWNSITGGDIDNDGDTDYILGNHGDNSIIKASVDKPVRLYYPKLNFDTRPDPILSYYVGGKETLFAKRDKMLDQILSFRKRFITYTSYAQASPKMVAGETAPFHSADNLRSVAVINEGNGSFKVVPLPPKAQLFPVFGIHLIDLDHDNFLDLTLSGNCFYMSNEIGNLDAGGFLALKGSGNGQFEAFSDEQLGLYVRSDAKALGFLGSHQGDYRWLLTSNNSASMIISCPKPQLVQMSKSTAAYICLSDGTRRRTEHYFGTAFWTQHAPFISLPNEASICP